MNFKDLKNKIKEEQKTLALKIRRGKFLRKPVNRETMTDEEKSKYIWTYRDEDFFLFHEVDSLSEDYRHRHIVYCEMFNNTLYDKIEKPRDNNLPKGNLINKIREEWDNALDETLCHSA